MMTTLPEDLAGLPGLEDAARAVLGGEATVTRWRPRLLADVGGEAIAYIRGDSTMLLSAMPKAKAGCMVLSSRYVLLLFSDRPGAVDTFGKVFDVFGVVVVPWQGTG